MEEQFLLRQCLPRVEQPHPLEAAAQLPPLEAAAVAGAAHGVAVVAIVDGMALDGATNRLRIALHAMASLIHPSHHQVADDDPLTWGSA